MVPLDDHIEILSGFAFDASMFSPSEGVPLIRIRDVVRGRTETHFSGAYDSKYIVTPGELLVGMDGDFNRSIWRSDPALLNQRVCKITARAKSLDQRYLYHFLPAGLYEIWKSTPFATVKHLSVKGIRAIHIPLPSLDEQRRIAAILDKADDLRAKRRQALAHLDTLTQSIFHAMFPSVLTFRSVELSELVRNGDRINYGVVQPGEGSSEGVPLIRVADLVSGSILPHSLKKISANIEKKYVRSRIFGYEILVSCVGTIGKTLLASPDLAGCNIARAVARIPLSEDVDRVYVKAVLDSAEVQNYFTSELRTVSQPTLNIRQLAQTTIPLPPMELQQAFEARVAAVERLKDHHLTQLAELDSLFASLQHRAFREEL